jgi:hypothetical protein
MDKIKNWIRIKLKKFLDVENLEQQLDGYARLNNRKINELEKDSKDRSTYLRKLINENSKDILHFQDSVNVLHNTVENVVHIGTSFREYGSDHSWCVICIEGKINIVKFVDLDRGNAMEISSFLKRFEAGKHCIDTPYKEMFYNGLFKF